jgi:hypothetical protein
MQLSSQSGWMLASSDVGSLFGYWAFSNIFNIYWCLAVEDTIEEQGLKVCYSNEGNIFVWLSIYFVGFYQNVEIILHTK